jgi:uncharacterized RDD family membrane protein YckC
MTPRSSPEATHLATHLAADEVLTGEAVALDVQPTGVLLRAVGALIDVLLSVVLIIATLLIVTGPLAAFLPASTQQMTLIVTLVLVLVVLPTVVETTTRGRSLGRLAVGTRIVRSDGGASGFRQALIRALVGVFETYFTFGVIAVLAGAFTPRSQRLGDLLAGTYSQRTRVAPLPPSLPPVPPALEQWAAVVDVARLPDRLARRLAQFLAQVPRLAPTARERIAVELRDEVSAFVFPMPVADPLTALFGIAAARRDRERRALAAQESRMLALEPILERVPAGFPRR